MYIHDKCAASNRKKTHALHFRLEARCMMATKLDSLVTESVLGWLERNCKGILPQIQKSPVVGFFL